MSIKFLTNEEARQVLVERLKKGEIKSITCDDCPDKDVCEYAYDGYNTDGDCLAKK